MTLVTLEIPDDRELLPEWLEGQLVGLELASLVAELSAVHADGPTGAQSLDALLGDELTAVLSGGLASLSHDRLRHLLRQPALLFELQEQIFVDGGTYWQQRRGQSTELNEAVSRGWRTISEFVERETAESAGAVMPAPARGRRRGRARAALVALCAMALVVLAMFAQGRFRPSGPTSMAAWGWNRPGVLNSQLSGQDYLVHLADAADDWFDRRPTTADRLAERIAQFRQGCSTLILAEHEALSTEDRNWLVDKCRKWAAKFDAHLADVEAGGDVATVRSDVDETVRALVEALRTGPAATT